MITLELQPKTCMHHLLLEPTFDHFAFIEGEVITFNRFFVDGRIQKEFFEETPEHEYSYWRELQRHFLSIIRGKRTPLSFKIILSLSRHDFPLFLKEQGLRFQAEDIQGLYLNLRYDGIRLTCVSGISTNIFTMDKELERAWDHYVEDFFAKSVE